MTSITERYLDLMKRKAKVRPCHVNTASTIGDPCIRRLVYWRTDWEQVRLPEPTLQSIFDLGHDWEPLALRRLQEMGFLCFEQQRPLRIEDHNITGHIDLTITHPDWEGYPDLVHVADNKSCSGHVWDSLNCVADLLSRYSFARKWYGQGLIYLHARRDSEKQRFVLFLWHKEKAVPKEIWIDYDEDAVLELLRKADRVDECVASGERPERIPYSREECGRCEFRHLCVPDLTEAEGLVWVEDGELVAALEEMAELAEGAARWRKLDATVREGLKARFERGETKLVVGDWLIEGTQTRAGSWRKEITKLGEEGAEDE